jgi:hypothetical protein
VIRVEFPYAHEHLSPNARVHHMARWRAGKNTKENAQWQVKICKPRDWSHEGRLPISITFHPIAGKAAKDVDNYLASEKPRIDGVALGLGLDDKLFDLKPQLGEPVPHGAVVYEIGGEL